MKTNLTIDGVTYQLPGAVVDRIWKLVEERDAWKNRALELSGSRSALVLVTQSTEWPTMESDTQDAVLEAIALLSTDNLA